jgi:hypothetical protein
MTPLLLPFWRTSSACGITRDPHQATASAQGPRNQGKHSANHRSIVLYWLPSHDAITKYRTFNSVRISHSAGSPGSKTRFLLGFHVSHCCLHLDVEHSTIRDGVVTAYGDSSENQRTGCEDMTWLTESCYHAILEEHLNSIRQILITGAKILSPYSTQLCKYSSIEPAT